MPARITRTNLKGLPSYFQAWGLKAFASDSAYATGKNFALAMGDAYYNTTTGFVRVYTGSVWVNVITEDSAGSTSVTKDLTVNGNLTVNGTQTILNTQTVDSTDTNITVNSGGNQASAQDTAGLTVSMSDATNATIIYDKTLTSRWKIGDLGAEVEVVTVSGAQTLTNKTLDAASNTISNIANANISATAAIAYSKLALTGSIVDADISGTAAIAYSKLALTGSIVNADISGTAAIAYSKLALSNSIVNSDISATAAIAYSKLALSGSIVNTDISATAAIAYSKLALTGSIVNADISGTAAIAYSKLALAGSIVDADISSSAAIARSKIAAGTAGYVVYNDGTTGALNQEQFLAKVRGGAGADMSSVTFPSTGTLVTEAGSETLSNKEFSDPITFDQVTTPANPASGKNKLYVKSDNKFYTLDSTGVELPVGSGGGGTKNYLSTITTSNGSNNGNGDFETGTTTGWALGHVPSLSNGFPSSTLPTFGSGSSANLSIAIDSTTQLAAKYSLKYISSAATVAGDFLASDAFFIDAEDQAKVMIFKIYYKAASGASSADWSGTTTNSFGVAIWDVTNSAWIQPSGCFGFTQSSGVGLCTGTFQTTSNSTQYRLVVYNATATSGAITLQLDDFSVGPQVSPIGAAVTDWQSYTPTTQGFGTISANELQWRRVGSNLEIRGNFTPGTTTAATAELGLPSGLAVATLSNPIVVGRYERDNSTGSNVKTGVLKAASGNTYLTFGYDNFTSAVSPYTDQLGNGIVGSGEKIGIVDVSIPISGWSSNVQMSNDTDTRVVAAAAFCSANYTFTATQAVNYDKVLYDTHGAITTGAANTWRYTVPVSGIYSIATTMDPTGALTAGTWQVYKNGVQVAYITSYTTAAGVVYTGQVELALDAGDTIYLTGSTGFTVAGSVSIPLTAVYIHRLSGPSVIAASETIAAIYTDTSGGTIGTSSAVYKFTTKTKDTHGAYDTSTGLFTAPTPGTYRISANLVTASVTLTTSEVFNLKVYKNGSPYTYADQKGSGATGLAYSVATSTLVDLLAGDTLGIYTTSSVATTGNTSAGLNNLSIERIGN